jgi:hypothetical protein
MKPITDTAQCNGNHIKDKHNIKARDKLQASTGGRKHINTEKVNKQIQR